jgi:predicted protein tyrosine phosphatase
MARCGLHDGRQAAHCLDIPGEFTLFDPALVKLLEEKAAVHL